MRFSDIPGLHDVKEKLVNSIISNKIPQAQLFAGNTGGGALAMALAYSSALNCENFTQGDACGNCPSCNKAIKYIHPDIHYYFPVSNTKEIPSSKAISKLFLEPWREFISNHPYGTVNEWLEYFGGENKQPLISRQEGREIISDLSLKSFEGRYKTVIIWLPELMHPSAANSILKILEEPSGDTVFLMVSCNSGMLLGTILSRLIHVTIRPFESDEILNHLENLDIDSQMARRITSIVQGNLNEALKLSNNIQDDNYDLFKDWMRLCYQQDFSGLYELTEEFSRKSKVAQKSLLYYGLTVLREILVVNMEAQLVSHSYQDEEAFTEKFGKVLNLDQINTLSSRFEEACFHLERNAHNKILFLDLSLDICKTLKNK